MTCAEFGRALIEYTKDLSIPCPDKRCGASAGDACTDTKPGIVHFGRRLKRLLAGIR